jgi:hypothetical protein
LEGPVFSNETLVGTKVVFTPEDADVVGIYDTATNVFSTVPTGLTGPEKFRGGTLVGTQVVFTPYFADVVGIYDTATNAFSTETVVGGRSNSKGDYSSGGANNGAQVAFRRARSY